MGPAFPVLDEVWSRGGLECSHARATGTPAGAVLSHPGSRLLAVTENPPPPPPAPSQPVSRTQYYTATTLDGFIADASNSLDWLFAVPGEEGARDEFTPFFAEVGAMAMGSTTYEWVLAHEGLLEQPEKWQETYGSMPTFVFSSRDVPVLPGSAIRIVRGDVSAVHRDLIAAAAGRNVWVMGGGDLAGQFADAGLLDEVIVSVAPVTLGSGASLLPRRLLADRLSLTDVRRVGQFAELRYRVGPLPS